MTNTSCDREVYLKCFMEVNKTLIFDGTIASIDTRFQQQRVGSSTVVVKTPDSEYTYVTIQLKHLTVNILM